MDEQKRNLSYAIRDMLSSKSKAGRPLIKETYGLCDTDARFIASLMGNIDVISELYETDADLVSENVKYRKQTQRYADFNRVERKAFRDHARVENSLTEYSKALTDVLNKHSLHITTTHHDTPETNAVGVVHISDTHLNEIINLPSNRYDFTIASQRMQKYIYETTKSFKADGITTVVVAFTGDLLNSDRRIEELLTNATNRSKGTFIAVEILLNAILDLNRNFNVHVVSVVGNEARVNKDIAWDAQVASDSYDLTIFYMLKRLFDGKEGVTFADGDKLREVIEINGYNWLFIHGHQSGFNTSPGRAVTKLSKMYADQNINIRFTIFGHIHECLITDTYARNSSLPGANAYSEDGLLLTSRASQNIHAQYSNGDIKSTKIDLQNFDGYDGYKINHLIDAYNAKSASKIMEQLTVLKIG